MAINVSSLEGKEIRDDFRRVNYEGSRWGYTWGILKKNLAVLILLNVMTLITFGPGIAVIVLRNMHINNLGLIFPFNTSMTHPFVGDVTGMSQNLILSIDLVYFALLIASGLIASVGIAGTTYCIRKMLVSGGDYSFKGFFHGIKVCYFKTVIPVTLFLVFFYLSVICGDMKDVAFATDVNAGGAMTGYVFAIIATVIVGLYSAWLLSVGTSYRVSLGKIFGNAFGMMLGTPVQTIFMAGFSLIPVWLVLLLSQAGVLFYILLFAFAIFGFSIILLCWTSFTGWAFDQFIKPETAAPKEQVKKAKTPQQIEQERIEAEQQAQREILLYGKSDLASRPLLPIGADGGFARNSATFSRADIAAADAGREELYGRVAQYEKQHENDPEFVEYNKMFRERELALQEPEKGGKGKKNRKVKKISPNNLMK